MHQIDNTTSCGDADSSFFCGLETSWKILRLLTKYNLIYVDTPAEPWSANRLFKYANEEVNFGDMSDMRDILIERGFEQDLTGILVAFDVGKEAPPIRSEYWFAFYKEQLGSKDINYWEWLGNPEVKEICPELTHLLSLPEPSFDVLVVLKALSYGKDPFIKHKLTSFADFGNIGKFHSFEDERRSQLRGAFAEWHYQTLEGAFGGDPEPLEQIYKVCFSCDWDVIESILCGLTGEWFEILGVSINASESVVKAAWKRLAKQFHPDMKDGSTAKMTAINHAYDQFKKAREEATQKKWNAYGLGREYQWNRKPG